MKLIQLLGSRNKSDFAIYLGHTIASMGNRVLIVDATNNSVYLYSFIRIEEKEVLYEFQDIEILVSTKSWKELAGKLEKANEKIEDFDCIIVDTNDSSPIYNDWPKFHHVLYVSDNTRFTISQDVEILNDYVDATGITTLQRVHFESAHKIPNDYLNLLINNRLDFNLVYEPLEYDDQEHKLLNYMQHENTIPYNKLQKDYKKLLKSIVTEIYDMGYKDFEASSKRSPFGMFFGRFKSRGTSGKVKNHDSEINEEKEEQSQQRLVLNNVSKQENVSTNGEVNKKTKEVVGG